MKMSGHEKSNTNECSLGGGEGRKDGGFFPPSFLSNQVKAIKESLPTENYTPKLNISTVFGSLAVWLVQVDAG